MICKQLSAEMQTVIYNLIDHPELKCTLRKTGLHDSKLGTKTASILLL